MPWRRTGDAAGYPAFWARSWHGIYGAFGKGLRNLKSGMYGSDVMEIQKTLKSLGFFYRKY